MSDTATGAPGTACAGMVFNVSLVDPANGQVRFTPQGGAHVTLPGTGAVCRIGFTFSVLRAPGADQNPVQAGTQTVQVSDNTQFAGTLTASARGTLRRLSFPFGQICGATSAVPQRTFSRRVHGVTNAVSAGTRT